MLENVFNETITHDQSQFSEKPFSMVEMTEVTSTWVGSLYGFKWFVAISLFFFFKKKTLEMF